MNIPLGAVLDRKEDLVLIDPDTHRAVGRGVADRLARSISPVSRAPGIARPIAPIKDARDIPNFPDRTLGGIQRPVCYKGR